MMKLSVLPLGAYQANCFLAWEKDCGHAAVIDPGAEPERVLQALEKQGLTLDAILLTHGHFDHVGGVRALAEKTGCSVWIHPAELSLPPVITAGPLYYTALYDVHTPVQAGGLSFSVLHTPGHTPGSVCLLEKEGMFTGDTLFAGACGRTDLPGGDGKAMAASLHILRELNYDGPVYPGHGLFTRMDRERRCNPYLREEEMTE